MSTSKNNFGHKVSDALIRGFLSLMRKLPYDTRMNTVAWLADHILVPLSGNRQRIRDNLDLAMPELSKPEREKIVHDVAQSMGRMLMETYAGDEFQARASDAPIVGPGNAVLEQAYKDGKGAMLVTGHFGNYLAVRVSFQARGIPIGVLYKRMSNPFFNEHYVAAMSGFGEPMFERGRRGMANMLRHLRGGGFVGIVHDQRINDAPIYDFMGKPARTAESAAELALKYKVDLVPCYAIRQTDGSFVIETEAAIPHTNAQEMTQRLNDSLEAQVRRNPGQWMWTHNRWRDAGNNTAEDRARGN